MTIKIGSGRAVSSLMAAEAKKHGIIKPRLLSTLFAPAILLKVFEKYHYSTIESEIKRNCTIETRWVFDRYLPHKYLIGN